MADADQGQQGQETQGAETPATPVLSAVPGPDIEVGFARHGKDHSGKTLVLRVIASAKQSLRMACYNFTDEDIIEGLKDARKAGVDVQIVHDAKAADEKGDGTSAMTGAGIPIRLDHDYAIFHHKFIVVDGKTVQNGSFNYSHNADAENAENVLVLWDRPDIAAVYLKEWESLWEESIAPTVAPVV